MNLFKRIGKAVFEELHKPAPFGREEDFEQYVRDILFPFGTYQLVHRSHSHHGNKKDYFASSLLPDFGFRCEKTGKMFYVEVKFKERTFLQHEWEWFQPSQLERYKKIDQESHPIFLVLGLGANPQKPEEIFLIPVSKIEVAGFDDGFPNKYTCTLDQAVLSSSLWDL